jgi:hypothetical protein
MLSGPEIRGAYIVTERNIWMKPDNMGPLKSQFQAYSLCHV